MGIGAYRHLVTLEHPAVVLDPPTWYCAVQPAGAQVAEGLAAFFIRGRYHPGIGLETQIVFEGRTFQVQAVNDLDERHREIQVTAVEVVGRGTTPSGAPANVPPTIVEGPESATIDAGASVILTVIAAGAAPLSYQWTADGVDLPGEVYQFLETGPVTVTTAYAVRVSNAYGAVVSAPATVTVEVPGYQGAVIADGAVAYWPLDDPIGPTARDLMGTHDGTISGVVMLGQPGIGTSTAMGFAGAGSITLPSMTVAGDSSVEVWVKHAPEGPWPYNPIWTNRSAASLGNALLRFAYGALHFGTTSALANAAGDFRDNQWHHVVGTSAAVGGLKIYLDGVAVGSHPAILPSTTGAGLIGQDDVDVGLAVLTLQDVAIYPRALTPAEILAHYQLRVPAPAFPTEDLVSYWSFDSGWNDQVGTNHLTNVNGVTAVAGKLGNAADFESSSSQYLSCADNATLQTGDIDFTIACWVKFESLNSATVIAKDGGPAREYTLDSFGGFRFFRGGSANGYITVSMSLVVGTWYFVMAWHDAAADTVNLQIDNGTVNSAAASGSPVPGGSPFTVGSNEFSSAPIDGLIDEVGLWRRVLTAGERTTLWNGGAGLPYVP